MTELIWDGKYDSNGKKVAPLRIALPFQTVETVNESATDRGKQLDLFSSGRRSEWRNRLIWGDKKYVLPSLLPEFVGAVNLVYIDPPFDTGANFSHMATVPDDPEAASQGLTFVKEPSIIEQKAYRDTWGKGLDGYIRWFYDTLSLLYELIAADGAIFVHLDYHVVHYAKVVLDQVFGPASFQSEIIWKRSNPKSHITVSFPNCTDTILFYTKSDKYTFKQPYDEHDQDYLDAAYKYEDDRGRYRLLPLLNPNDNRPNLKYEFLGVTRVWRWTRDRMNKAYEDGSVVQLKPGAVPQYKKYLADSKGRTITNCWNDISQAAGNESVNYPTQKPEALLRRIIESSSNEGDLVLDCFCGSGTTAAVAEKLRRRWITCDLGRFAIHTTRKRLLSVEGVRPFAVQNLGKYERQAWQLSEFGTGAQELQRSYRHFILSLYRAQRVSGYVWLHGISKGRMVHVGGVDSPISTDDVGQIAAEFRRARGSGKDAPTQNGIDVLGWDFAFEMNEVVRQQAALAGVDVRFVRIPREVLEKKAVEQGDIKFFELAAVTVCHKVIGRTVQLNLTNFVMPLDDLPDEVRKAVTNWEQWIDYWAVDWDNRGDAFHNQWQYYRSCGQQALQKVVMSPANTYCLDGNYRIVVKVIDILGNDTTVTVALSI